MILRLWSKVTRSAEIIAAIILAAIFITFLLQIFTRYAPRIAWLAPVEPIQHWMQSLVPIGWTVNLISLLWVWLIFFSCSFFVREKDHVVFDVLVDVLPKTWRRIMASVTSLFLVGIMLYAFQPTYDAIFGSRLMDLKKIQTLALPISGDKIPIKWLFAPIILFMLATILRYAVRLFWLLTCSAPNADKTWPVSLSHPRMANNKMPDSKGLGSNES